MVAWVVLNGIHAETLLICYWKKVQYSLDKWNFEIYECKLREQLKRNCIQYCTFILLRLTPPINLFQALRREKVKFFPGAFVLDHWLAVIPFNDLPELNFNWLNLSKLIAEEFEWVSREIIFISTDLHTHMHCIYVYRSGLHPPQAAWSRLLK